MREFNRFCQYKSVIRKRTTVKLVIFLVKKEEIILFKNDTLLQKRTIIKFLISEA
jgi:hypothetical protein